MRILLISIILLITTFYIFGQQDECSPKVGSRESISRWLPQAFYDQAEESIQAIYPKHKIIIARRDSVIEKVEFALLVYQEIPEDTVHIVALAVYWKGRKAWDLEAAC